MNNIDDETDYCTVFVTCPEDKVALAIVKHLLGLKLVACGNILPGLRSVYRWQGAICDEPEVLLILKTKKDQFDAVAKQVQALHPYDVPEVVALPIVQGNSAYLQWINDCLQ